MTDRQSLSSCARPVAMEVSKEVLRMLPGVGVDGVTREGFTEEAVLE